MNSHNSLSFSRLLWILPIFFWLIAVGILIGLGDRDASSHIISAQPKVTQGIPNHIEPGFYAEYNKVTTRWLWQYISPMKNGCQKLMLRKDNPVEYDFDNNIVTIDLMTYGTDDTCDKAPILASYTGSIHTDPNTTFIAKLDGKRVFP